MKTKPFLLKSNLKFMSQKFERKNRRNKLLNFSQMFNMRALGYAAHIETVFYFSS